MKFLIGNLKMNLSYFETQNYLNETENLIKKENLKNTKIGQAVSHDSMSLILNHQNRNFLFGAQNIFHLERGAYTGEVSIRTAKELNLDFVLIGHSERRMMFNETDELINQKIITLEGTNVRPVLCVGEDLATFEAKKTYEFIENQLKKCLKNITDFGNLIISYEPIYCIGNGIIPEICHIEHVIQKIKEMTHFSVPVLYGGSVSLKNIKELIKIGNCDGFLVGGAALNPTNFIEMAKILDTK
ncbi:triose-phosphate isomerase [[Mycoplasma] anseris]|uniref:Triosephosphate isomerase n=1 Tax=[Mycoplasma] anseris TaxID=92400 RepID=A0A2Z4NCZ5_9BACT|nr:triose-phosphate isomerase family protein [[Mycoplasma] anseris]AWX69438.1 triosephosphate isomerase [[Mycoplasma] anseris]